MTDSTYVQIPEAAMRSMLEGECGFEQIHIDGTYELVFQRQVTSAKGREFPYAVRVYSSISNGKSRAVGEDAIRVVLINLDTGYPIKIMGEGRKNRHKKTKAGSRINRTAPTGIPTEKRVEALLGRLKDRCRDYFYHIVMNPCPTCGSALAMRWAGNGDFYGCTNFPDCRHTQQEINTRGS